MRTTAIKIIVIVGILLVTSLISVAMNGGRSNGRAPIFVIAGAIAAISAVWKYKPKSEREASDDNHELDKKS